jgi:hypothetical protein
MARMVINQSKKKCAINKLAPFKSAWTDDIVPALMENGVEHFASYLCSIFRDYLAYGYIP